MRVKLIKSNQQFIVVELKALVARLTASLLAARGLIYVLLIQYVCIFAILSLHHSPIMDRITPKECLAKVTHSQESHNCEMCTDSNWQEIENDSTLM